ncbi:hypothetical protein JL720_15096 [Aureococcus anophagefferens]|nr:hypothetical protein JL720_15096 [Aureococcus anophagefferens]
MSALDAATNDLATITLNARPQNAALENLENSGDARIGWPDEKPPVPTNSDGWFLPANQQVLRDLVKPDALVLELGSYIGKSTRFIAGLLHEGGHLLTCDAWDNDLLEGALGHNYLRSDDEKRSFELYETFLVGDSASDGARKQVPTPSISVGEPLGPAPHGAPGSRPLHVGGFVLGLRELPRPPAAASPHDNPIAMGGVTFWPDARKQERRDVLLFRCVFDQLQAWDNAEALEYLLEATACADAVAPGSGERAQLAPGGRLDAVAELLRLGADATLRTKYDETAEDAARANGQDACAELLRTGAAPARRDAATDGPGRRAKGEKAPWFDAAATAVYARTPPPPRRRRRPAAAARAHSGGYRR